MKKKISLPYLKENNLLQLPIFCFSRKRPKKTVVEWSDKKNKYKLECHCDEGVPGSLEQDIYSASMRLYVKNGMPKNGVLVNYSEIAQELDLTPAKNYVTQIKKALERLGLARYKFKQCFLVPNEDGVTKEVDAYFSLYESAYLFSYVKGKTIKKNSKSHLRFPKEIKLNLEKLYYQYLDMAWYKSLPEGLPRRLYEYLAKREYHAVNRILTISEESLSRWLPINDKNPTNRHKRIERISNALIKQGFLTSYKFDSKKKHCIFTYAKSTTWSTNIEVEKSSNLPQEELVLNKQNIESAATDQQAKLYKEAMEWLDTIKYFHKKRRQEIADKPISSIAKIYRGIRDNYESQEKKPSVGWLYKAFIEEWEFPTKVDKTIADNSPKAKKAREAKAIYDNMSKDDQDDFICDLREFIGESMADEVFDEFFANGKIWLGWAQLFLVEKGLLEPTKN